MNKLLSNLSPILILSLYCSSSFADQYHYSDILIGDRAAGFGGAYTAISDDPSGLYYNPAGIVRAPDGQLSASANAFNLTTYTYSNINASDHTWERTSSANIANFFGVFQTVGDGFVGFSIAAPDSNKASQDETFHDYAAADPLWKVDTEIINYKEDDSTLLFGPTYAIALNDSLSFGLTLYGHMRNAEFTFRQDVRASLLTDSSQKVYDIGFQKFKTAEYGIKPIFGLMWDATQAISIGASFSKTFLISQTPMAQINRNTNASVVKTGTSTVISQDTTGQSTANPQNATDSPVGMQALDDRELPYELKLGIAYYASPSFIISSNIDLYSETNDYDSVVNISVGTEYFLSHAWSTRLGFNTNNSNNKSLDEVGFDVDEYGLSLSLSKHNRLSVLNFGINAAYGEGQARLLEGSNRIQDITIQSITGYIATSMNF